MAKNNRRGHRYARGALHADRDPRVETYFVPSYGVERRVAQEDAELKIFLRAARKRLDRHYTIIHPSKASLDIIDRNKFIVQMRSGKVRPSAEEMKDMALSCRDDLQELTADTAPGLALPLGKVARFGVRRNLLGVVPAGWRGWRSHYARRDARNNPLALGTIVAETKLSIGGIAASMAPEAPQFVVDGLAETPHIIFATHNGSIPDHKLWAIQDRLDEFVPGELLLDDPVISLITKVRQGRADLIHVREQPAAEAMPALAPEPPLSVEW